MVPGLTERECQYAELRRQELLANAARERRFIHPPSRRPRNRTVGTRRRLRAAFTQLLAMTLRYVA